MVRCWIMVWLLLGSVVTYAEASAADTAECPTLPVANSKLQARAAVLLAQVERAQSVVRGAGPAGVDLVVALASVIAGRAKEEARIWLLDQLSTQICSSSARRYFANTCEAAGRTGDYPGPSLNLLRTHLRRDIYALPACYGYLHIGAAPAGPARIAAASPDEMFDAYVLEAALVGVYLKSKAGSTISDDVPMLETVPSEEVLGRLIVGAAFARLRWSEPGEAPQFVRSAFADPQSKDEACSKPSPTDIKALADSIIALLKNPNPKATPEAVLAAVVPALKHFCAPLADDLNAMATVYVTATHGDYVETALGAASTFLCDTKGAAPAKLCARLPLLAEVAQAETQEDVEAALDRVISPLGAWKRKQSEWVVSLNAMAGVGAGKEEFKDSNESGDHSTYGLYLPIGVESSWPIPKSFIRSVAVGVQALDLGAIVSYSEKAQVEGGETASDANTRWSSVTSPGAYVAVAFKNSPFRLGLSYSKTPKLRSVNFSDGTEKDVDSTRVMIFFTVDVTLLAF